MSVRSQPTVADSTPEAGLGALAWVPLVHGAITIVFGILLVAVPERTLTFVATLAGISLCVAGLINLAQVFGRGQAGDERFGGVAVGLLALVAGAVVIARPEGSIKTVAVVAGVYLVIMGVVTLFLGARGVRRGASLVRGALGLAAGAVLLVWPDVTVGVIATVYGVFLLALGAVEIYVGLALRRQAPA